MAGDQGADLSSIHDEIVGLLKQYLNTPEELRTRLVRRIAELLADVRGTFQRKDGSPDWQGRSHAYRLFIGAVYDDAGLPAGIVPSIQASVRYHIGDVLRERLDDATLREYGLVLRSPKQRSQDQRAAKSTLLGNIAAARDGHGGSFVAITAAVVVLERVKFEDLRDLSPRERRVVEEVLDDFENWVVRCRNYLSNLPPTPEGAEGEEVVGVPSSLSSASSS